MQSNNIKLLAISETHLGSSIEEAEISIHGYNIIRSDKNRYEGGVAVSIQNHIPAKQRQDLMLNG